MFPRSFIFVFDSTIDSLYLTDWASCSKVDMLWITLNLCRRKILQHVFRLGLFDLDLGLFRFRLFKDLKTSLKHVNDFDELKLHYYPEEVHRSFCYCYYITFSPLWWIFWIFKYQFFSAKHPQQWGIIKLTIYKYDA